MVQITVKYRTFLKVELHSRTCDYSTNKMLILKVGKNKVNNWLFENFTLDEKNIDEGDLIGNIGGTSCEWNMIRFLISSDLSLGSNIFSSVRWHHIEGRNCVVHDFQSGGIGGSHFDYTLKPTNNN